MVRNRGIVMISITNLNKTLGDKQILKDVNLSVAKGSIYGLIGANGAGKTTLIKCLVGIYKNEEGHILIDGEEVYENSSVKGCIGYVADDNSFMSHFKVKNLIEFYRLSYDKFDMDRFNDLNKIFEIPLNKGIKKLSKGMKTRLSLMLNLSIKPKLLVLDEPTSGLDPIIKKKLMSILMEEVEMNKTTIFISSHNLSDLERICDGVAIMEAGEIKYANSVDEMKKNIKKLQLVLRENIDYDFSNIPEILNVSKIGRVYSLITKEYNEELQKKLKALNLSFIEEIDLSLEDMFIYSVEGAAEGNVERGDNNEKILK